LFLTHIQLGIQLDKNETYKHLNSLRTHKRTKGEHGPKLNKDHRKPTKEINCNKSEAN